MWRSRLDEDIGEVLESLPENRVRCMGSIQERGQVVEMVLGQYSMRRPTLSKSVIRGLENWIAPMSILLECPDDSELQVLSRSQLDDCVKARDYIVALIQWRESFNKRESTNVQ